jgi:hypothetical protein
MITGAVLIVASVILGVTAAVIVVKSTGRPLYETMTNESRPTPVKEELTLRAGRYTVYELTGPQTGGDPVSTTDPPLVTAKDVKVTGPDKKQVPTSGAGSTREELTRDQDVYTGVVRFTTPEAGRYQVRVTTAKGSQVVIAPSLGSGFKAVLSWVVVGFASSVTFVIGVIVLIVGAVRRRRKSTPKAARGSDGPAKGWYPAPDLEGKQRYWDGQAWTQYLR